MSLDLASLVPDVHCATERMTPPSHTSGSGLPAWISLIVGACVLIGIVLMLVRRR